MAKNEGEKGAQAAEGSGTGDGARDAGAGAGAEYDAAYGHAAAGRTAEAEALCREILASDPTHAEALYLLGGIAAQGGNARFAIELFTRALEAKPDLAKAHSDRGSCFWIGARRRKPSITSKRRSQASPTSPPLTPTSATR